MKTSEKLIKLILEQVDSKKVTLEPSAGYGDISTKLVKDMLCTVDVVELNNERATFLKKQGIYRGVYKVDFLKYSCYNRYQQVVAVPPYEDNIDCQHIMKMYDYLLPGGRIITLTLPYWVTGIYKNQRDFRIWLEDKLYTVKFIEHDKSYLQCPKMLLTIQKPS